MRTNLFLLLTISLSLLSCGRGTDVCIYGGSSACVTAAYSAAHEGCKVVIICPDKTIGGMTTGGLGQTDIGNKQAVIGLARNQTHAGLVSGLRRERRKQNKINHLH